MASCRHTDTRYFQPVTDAVYHKIKAGAGPEVLYTLDSLAARDSDNGELKLSVYQCKKEYYYRREATDTNNLYVDSILYVLEHYKLKDKYPAVYADALNNKGNMFFEVNNLATAFEYYYKARVAVVLTGDTCLLADQSYHLGMICYRQEKYQEAIKYFTASWNETGRCKDGNVIFYRRCELTTNIALAQDHLGMHDSALKRYQYLLVFIDTEHVKYHDPNINKFAEVAHAVAYGNIANVFIAQQQYDTAIKLLNRSIAINTRPAYDNKDALYSSMKLAELYHETGNTAMMLATLNGMQHAMDSIRDETIYMRWDKLMFDYNRQRGDWHNAVEVISSYLQHKDTLEHKTQALKQTDYAQLMQNQEKEYQLSILRKNNEVANAYLLASVAFIVIILIVGVSVLFNFRKSRQTLKEMQALNDKINQQNKQLATAMNELVVSNREKDRILHVVAHDLRSPVSAITMLTELVMDEVHDQEALNMLRLINVSCQSQLSLINELLARSNKADSRTSAHTEILDLNELLSNAVSLLRFRAGEKQQDIILSGPDTPVYVNANKENIIRVINNFITNAIKFSQPGGKVLVSLTATPNTAIISVADKGIGIPDKMKPQVFDEFTEAKRRGTHDEQSFGLGLSISKKIVEESGGRIWFESEEDKGSTFYMSLPVARQ
jgi:two-component system sensor histidine kinase VicK